MIPIIAAEHFTLTPSIEECVLQAMNKISDVLPEEAQVRFFLSKSADHEFTALCKVHLRGKDIIARDTGPDLYVAINHAALRLRRKFIDDRDRKRSMNRHLEVAR